MRRADGIPAEPDLRALCQRFVAVDVSPAFLDAPTNGDVDLVVRWETLTEEELARCQHPHADVDDREVLAVDCHQDERIAILCRDGVQRPVDPTAVFFCRNISREMRRRAA